MNNDPNNKTGDIDSILDDIIAEFGSNAPVSEEPVETPVISIKEEQPAPVKKSGAKRFGAFLGKTALILLETVLLLVIALYGVMYVLAKGPSPTAQELFVRSVRETSAIGFLANIYFSDEEIAQIESAEEIEEYQETDTSLITIQKPEVQEGPVADEWGLVDEDGDGIILTDGEILSCRRVNM